MQVPVYGPYPVLDSRRFHNPTSPLSVSDSQSLHPLSRGFAAQMMYYVVWNMREAHVPHNVIHLLRGEAARERVKTLRIRHAQRAGRVMEAAGIKHGIGPVHWDLHTSRSRSERL